MSEAVITRKTKETDITVRLNADGSGVSEIDTGIGFFDHMLTALSRHSGIDLNVSAKGDLMVDAHHTVEDVGIVIGSALAEVFGDYSGLTRYGEALIPMDEALALCVLDISNRPFLVFDAEFNNDKIGDFDTALTEEFFRAIAVNAGITLHLKKLYGKNDHHSAEALFKAFAHALKKAIKPLTGTLSTKGSL
jgi:imidazoleglycerol-phosphate dehydratase